MKSLIPSLQRVGTFSSGLVRPISLQRQQLAVLVRDASSSMAGEKARAADGALRALATELANPGNRGAFTIAVIDFSSSAKLVHPPEAAETIVPHLIPLSASGMTNVAAALTEAENVVRSAPKQFASTRPVVLLFSDGRPNCGGDARAVAAGLTSIADIVTVAFGSDADEEFLRAIATSPSHFYRCRDGRDLRKFFTAVGATLSQSIASGVPAAGPLGTLAP